MLIPAVTAAVKLAGGCILLAGCVAILVHSVRRAVKR